MWRQALTLVVLLATSGFASVCPDSCSCSTTRDGLHRAACGSVADLYKFSIRQKHHNINILDLSHNNITTLTHELDRLTEIVTLDLSTNGFTEVTKFLHNAKKLVHLSLANNRIKHLNIGHLPTSVSSLDLTNNLLQDVPYNFEHLKGLEHLEMEGNPLDCSCYNMVARDKLIKAHVVVDDVKCTSPKKYIGQSWLSLKSKDICKTNLMDMMMGDQPMDVEKVGEESTALKSMALTADNDLEDGNIIHHGKVAEEDDSFLFMKVDRPTEISSDIAGSGDGESTTDSVSSKHVSESDEQTEDPFEGSGFEGSGFGFKEDEVVETSTHYFELYTGPVSKFFDEDDSNEFTSPVPPTVYAGGADWYRKEDPSTVSETTEAHIIPPTQAARDTTVSEQIRVTQAADVNTATSTKQAPHKTGTYVCIAIIVVLLVGLIGFAVVKSQLRKRRDKRILRIQKRDVEQASKEMVDMNKSLLGKAGNQDVPEKKMNGKYELVPTHEKKGENGDLTNGNVYKDTNEKRTDSPRDTNQNKNSSKDNNLIEETPLQSTPRDTSFDSALTSNDSKKDASSLSSEDLFVPINEDDMPRVNGTLPESDVSQPLLNGDQDTDYLSPRGYVPVYSPDMGRVRIKLTETPKPTTPILVTRSRSNAGDIIITPALDGINGKAST